jgi:hypothetical protein
MLPQLQKSSGAYANNTALYVSVSLEKGGGLMFHEVSTGQEAPSLLIQFPCQGQEQEEMKCQKIVIHSFLAAKFF